MNGFWLALGFLTTLPARPVPYVPGGLGRAAAWFPVIGLLIGVLLLLVQVAAARLLGPLVAAVLVVAVVGSVDRGPAPRRPCGLL